MRTKDTILLEQAYGQVREAISSRRAREIDAMHFKNNNTGRPSQETLDSLIAGFHMNPNRQSALAAINEGYLGKVVTLYKHGHGAVKAGSDQYESEYELTQNDGVTGKVEKIHYTQDENGYHLIFVINGQSYDLTQDGWWVKPASEQEE